MDFSSDSYAEGFRIDGPTPEELARALDAAFDYRGDVTLVLADGEEVTGYLFNRDGAAAEPHLDLFPRDSDCKRRILYRDIRGVRFSGKDTASGRSWATWVEHHRERKAARERGEDVGAIGLDAEPLA
jgi:hypothetical protein